ncbi:Bug family tripartite tricarboxylate transporter substrate binding protein [Ramlibacter sp. AN1133]|uniref:Bug family tripartite tricarboxylate transporter substrate binding protein n=1 Tax=Ramlibacter sp. AN1133 TaxID=3133429 RepID=UPI0030BFD581
MSLRTPARRGRRQAVIFLLAALPGLQAPAQPVADLSGKPVTIITAFSAGSGPDAMMRAVGEKLSAQWKTPVIIDNRPGGAGFIAINAARSAPPDGHTLLMHEGDALGALPHLFPSRNFRLFDAFEPVGVLYSTPFFIVVPAASRFKSVADLVAAARSAPGKVTYGSWGVGSTAHLQTALFEKRAGVRMLHVPYKEMGQLYTGVSTGETDWALGAMASTRSVYESHRVRYLAVTANARLADLPDVPTVAESGGPSNFEASGFVALLAPKGTPEALRERIHKDLVAAIASPEVQARYRTFHFEATPWTPEQTRRVVEARSASYGQVIRANGIRLD